MWTLWTGSRKECDASEVPGGQGSCLASPTTVSLKGACFIPTVNLSPSSKLQLVDCDAVVSACQGGLMDNDFARDCRRPLRSSTQPWGIEKSRYSMSLSDLTCFANCNQIGTAMPPFPRTVGDRESRKTLCWMTSQLQELSKMRNVYTMTFDFCAKWRKRTTVLAGHVESADVWALDTMRCRGHKRCSFTGENTCNSLTMTLFINARVHTEAESIR